MIHPPTAPHDPVDLISALEEARAAEKTQALFYRALAAEAEDCGDDAMSERFNELHADEQHHVSRLSVRLMEMGAQLHDIANLVGESVGMKGWEPVAAAREAAEVRRYEALLETEIDEATRGLINEILDTERHHAAELGGKWTMA